MHHDPDRVTEDLRGLISGDVRCDELFAQQYASDASIFQIRPLGVVSPRSTEDVVAVVRYAGENQIPLHARGAGSGLAGESLGEGLVLDFSRHMRRFVPTDDESCRVQPGVVLGQLNRHLARRGRCFGPQPHPPDVTTLGGLVSVNASGGRRLRYGAANRHVESIQAVLADGSVHEFSRHALEPRTDGSESPRLASLVRSVAGAIDRRREVIDSYRARCAGIRSGYAVCNALKPPVLDMVELLAGSEGTLALFTEITVRSEPIEVERTTALFFFDSLEKAARAVLAVLPHSPTACDLMDRRHVSLAREDDVRYELSIPSSAEAVLLVEVEGSDAAEAHERIERIIADVQHRRKLAAAVDAALDPQDIALHWRLSQRYSPMQMRLEGPSRPVPFLEDIVVPPEQLARFIADTQETLKRKQVTASLFAHAGHGQVHLFPILDLRNPEDRSRLQGLADAIYAHAWELGGMIGGRYGDGLSRTPYLASQFGPLCDVFREIKRIFDPQNLLNPGKIVPTGPTPLMERLRATAQITKADTPSTLGSSPHNGKRRPESTPVTVTPELDWSGAEALAVANSCHGCGLCRSLEPDVRMCPIFRVSPREEASPRAKANLFRAIMDGQLSADVRGDERFKEIVDLCVHCHMCRLECPAEVDIPQLMLESRAAYVRDNGLKMADWFFAHIDAVSAFGSRLSYVANWALGNRLARWILERTVGLAQGRKLPRLARRTFLQQAHRRGWTRARREGMRVALFVDTYANYYDPSVAHALIEILQHHGVSVFVPPGQTHSAMPLLAAGALEPARAVARQNVDVLAEAVRQGHTIVCTEPSAALALIHEYPRLFADDDDVLMVSRATREACHYLWQFHLAGRLRLEFNRVDAVIGYHLPCHLKALGVGSPGENLLRLIPGLKVSRVERGCSGMAGTWGMRRANYRNSLRAGMELITTLRDGPYSAGATECSTCTMQMQQSTRKATLHPVKVLAHAYGLAPDVASRLNSSANRNVISP